MNRNYLFAASLLLLKLTDIGMQGIENHHHPVDKAHDINHHNDETPDRPTGLPKYKKPFIKRLSATYVVVPPN